MTSDRNFFVDKTDRISCNYFKADDGILSEHDFLTLQIVSRNHLDDKQNSDLSIYIRDDCYHKLAEIRDAITKILNEVGYKPTNSCNTENAK